MHCADQVIPGGGPRWKKAAYSTTVINCLNALAPAAYQPGEYHAALKIYNDDPLNNPILVPLTMTVLALEYGVALAPDSALHDIPGQAVTYALTVTNTSQAPLKGSLVLRALDARNVAMGDPATLPLEVSAGGQDDIIHTFTVPSTVASGTAILSAVIQDAAGNVVGGGYAPFEVPFSPLSLELASLPTLQGGTTASIGVNVTNQSSDEAVEHGEQR